MCLCLCLYVCLCEGEGRGGGGAREGAAALGIGREGLSQKAAGRLGAVRQGQSGSVVAHGLVELLEINFLLQVSAV